MARQLTIQAKDEQPLGEIGAVREKIQAALPGVRFDRQPSGAEQLAAAEAKGIAIPDALRQTMGSRPAKEKAEYEGEDFSLELLGFETVPLEYLIVMVEGDGDPTPALAALCRPNGWFALDDATDEELDFG